MNSDMLLCQVMRTCRDYQALCDGIAFERRKAKPRPQAVTGLCDGAEPVFMTTLAQDEVKNNNRVLILYSTEKQAADEALRLSSEGITAYHFPARDYNFSINTASRDYEHRRLLVLSQILFSDEAFAICATAEAALQITVSPEELIQLTSKIRPNSTIDVEHLSLTLLNAGYSRVELVEGQGQFAIRGGIIDVFPPADNPVRIELFGDDIDRIGTFDPITQRFQDVIDNDFLIPPAHELILNDERREIIISICKKQIEVLEKKPGKEHIAEILKNEIVQLSEGYDIGFADKYLSVICPSAECLLNYFDGLVVIYNTTAVKEKLSAAVSLTQQSINDMISQGEINGKIVGTYINEWDRVIDAVSANPSVLVDSFTRSHPGMIPSAEYNFATRHIPPYAGNTVLLMDDLARFVEGGYKTAVLCANEQDAKNISKALLDENITNAILTDNFSYGEKAKKYPVCILYGESDGGFELINTRFAFMDYAGVSQGASRFIAKKRKFKNKKNTQSIMSYNDLSVGDYVVHEAYGIGVFQGIETLTTAGMTRDYVRLVFAGDDKLYLPVDQLDMLSKYIGAATDGAVKLSKLGGSDWTRAKTKASASAKEMAKELIELYARRRKAEGYAFPADDDMTRQFGSAFEYEETDSQLTAIEDLTRDMEKPWPMERMICGDVGYGKTEVALRAAFKAVAGGKQVAILAPTTILAYQHYQTALNRFRGFPVSIDMLSRFRTKSQQDNSLRKLRRGETDIIIGTHRVFSKDVEFSDLGLIIIDEEQRFGVAQKEKLKKLAIGADILTLTATPIPRTLNMAMGGIVDMSILDDVPGLRSPVQTYVMEHDDEIIAEALRRELRRGGQAFYLNNNVEYLYTLRKKLEMSLPEARLAVAHGKLDHEELEEIWAALVRGEIDILICTTIIETGVDVPNANTLIIENADRFGLSQLHQIRGRVGRSSRRAYAYFTYPKMKQISEVADKRLSAMKEYAAFGAGFKIALRDLEIRGAGNLLGSQQHGHMEAVGYDLYMKLLEEAVIEEKGEAKQKKTNCSVNVISDAFLPKSYIKDPTQRMEMYRKIARIQNDDDLSDILDELCDRFGEPPRSAMNLCRIALVKGLGVEAGFIKIEEREKEILLSTNDLSLGGVRAIETKKPGTARVTLGQTALITLRKPKGVVICDWLADLIKLYISEKNSEDSQ